MTSLNEQKQPLATLELTRHYGYGRVRFEPVNELAMRFAELLGQNTLTELNVEQIKALGYRVVLAAREPEEL